MLCDSLYAETHQCFLAKSILELKTREKQENCRDFKSRHKKYTSDGAGVAKQPKMAANIVTLLVKLSVRLSPLNLSKRFYTYERFCGGRFACKNTD